jgi:putative DNA primase/helicase
MSAAVTPDRFRAQLRALLQQAIDAVPCCEAERDPQLVDALKAELYGILAWAVAGSLSWLEDGLRPPDEVMLATEQYRCESDTLGAFIEEWCELAPDAAAPASELYAAYKQWASDGNEHAFTQTMFGRKLEERGITTDKRGRGNDRVKWRVGIRLVRSPAASAGPLWTGQP